MVPNWWRAGEVDPRLPRMARVRARGLRLARGHSTNCRRLRVRKSWWCFRRASFESRDGHALAEGNLVRHGIRPSTPCSWADDAVEDRGVGWVGGVPRSRRIWQRWRGCEYGKGEEGVELLCSQGKVKGWRESTWFWEKWRRASPKKIWKTVFPHSRKMKFRLRFCKKNLESRIWNRGSQTLFT